MNVFSTGASKLYQFPGHLNDWKAGKAITPVTLEIHPTERCNHNCPNCQSHYSLPISESKQRAREGADLDLTLLDSIWEEPPQGIVLSGHTGEPLLHPQIDKLLVTLKKHHIPTALVTNGGAITQEVAELALSTCRGIRISLDAWNLQSFKYSHGGTEEKWHQVLDGISILVRVRSKMRLNHLCMIGVGYLTNKETEEGMLRATIIAQNLGVDYIQFRPYHYDFEDISIALNQCKKLENAKFRVLASTQKYDRFKSESVSYEQCHGAWFYTVIDAQGSQFICCHQVGREEAYIGSLRDYSWSTLLRHPDRERIIKSYPNESCVPFCRLNALNYELKRLESGDATLPPSLPTDAVAHAMFL